ncbi:MAG TPA: carboxypeptidase-like regulatory domain-containing protein [Vicinamibacterales bacterium]|nr:carboxypeptidase-like regulatory domain-containing protein [Vicinamibacterales bacterium]
MATRRMHGFASWLVGITLLVGSSSGPHAQVPRDAAPDTSGTAVRGRVIAGDTGAPVTDARIVVRSADIPTKAEPMPLSVLTPAASVDAAGRFELPNLPPGRYRLIVAPGPAAARYLIAEYPDPASEPPLVVSGNRPIEGIAIALRRAAVITGRVVNERGDPLSGVMVSAIGMLSANRTRRPQAGLVQPIARTDDNGHFRIFGLPPGEYVLQGMLPRVTFVNSNGPTAPAALGEYLPTYSPGTLLLSEAARIRVQGGDEVGPIEFAVGRRQALTVRGTLVDSAGQPVGGVRVTIATVKSALGMTGLTAQSNRADGSFALSNVLPGENILSAVKWGDSGQEYASVPLTIAGNIDGLVVPLRRAVTIRGRVAFDGPAPAAFESLKLRAVPLLATQERGAITVQPEADGSFAIDNQVGPLLLRAIGLPGWHVKSVSYGGRDITDVPTEFTSSGPSVEVLLTRNSATLTGIVRTTQGAGTEAAVLIFGRDPSQWDGRFTTTRLGHADGQGRYRLDGLRAGQYLAIALSAEDVYLDDPLPNNFELLATLATPVVLNEGASVTLDLKRITPGALP